VTVLVFAPHPDDEIIGCGGTIARHAASGDDVYICIVTRGLPPVYNHDPKILKDLPHDLYEEAESAHRLLGVKHTIYLQYPAVMLETVPRHELNGSISGIVEEYCPDVVYIPHFGDMQKDHAVTAAAVMVAVRPKRERIVRAVYAYETLSETEWNIPHPANSFIPDTYVDISGLLDLKLRAMAAYGSQIAKFPHPRSPEAMEALARLRGSTMGSVAAEAFMLIREYRR
jgi:LmbE family N-acetylglucosaminyl deacetylase